MPINDNDLANHGGVILPSDAHGYAALLLVESLIHGLCENATISNGEAAEIAERAVSVQFDQAEAADGETAPMWRSHAMLVSIAASLRVDDGGPPPPRLIG